MEPAQQPQQSFWSLSRIIKIIYTLVVFIVIATYGYMFYPEVLGKHNNPLSSDNPLTTTTPEPENTPTTPSTPPTNTSTISSDTINLLIDSVMMMNVAGDKADEMVVLYSYTDPTKESPDHRNKSVVTVYSADDGVWSEIARYPEHAPTQQEYLGEPTEVSGLENTNDPHKHIIITTDNQNGRLGIGNWFIFTQPEYEDEFKVITPTKAREEFLARKQTKVEYTSASLLSTIAPDDNVSEVILGTIKNDTSVIYYKLDGAKITATGTSRAPTSYYEQG